MRVARFKVASVLRLAGRHDVVFVGEVVEERIEPGMVLCIPLQGELYSCIPILGVEDIRNTANVMVNVGLRCAEQAETDSDVYADLCPPGTVIEVRSDA